MLDIIIVIVAGVAIGYVFRRCNWLRRIDKTISGTVYVMLFVLGITVGANEVLLKHWASIGGQALLLSVAGVAGTLTAVCLLRRFIRLKKGGR